MAYIVPMHVKPKFTYLLLLHDVILTLMELSASVGSELSHQLPWHKMVLDYSTVSIAQP